MANEAQYDVALKITATSGDAEKAIQEVDKSLKQFVKNVTGSEAALKDFNDEQDNTTKKAEKSASTFDNLSKAVSNLGETSKSVEKSLSSIGSSLRQTGTGFSKFLTAPILALGTLATKSFGDQQAAIQLLNQSLINAGTFTNKASLEMQAFAASLQSSSVFSGDLIIQQLAIARNFTSTNEGAQKLVKAAADLSAATGKDLPTSVKELGKSLGGIAGGLDETIPALRNYTREQLIAGAAIDLVSKKFSGSARASSETFNGSIAKLRNTFGDLLTQVGAELAPFFSALVRGFQSAVDILSALDGPTRRTILLFGAFAAGIGPVLVGLGLFSSAVSKGLAAIRVLGTTLVKIGALLAGPAGLVVGFIAVGTTVAGLVNVFLELRKTGVSAAESFILTWRFATSAFESFVIKPILIGLQKIYDVLGRIPGFAGQIFRDSSSFLGGLIQGINSNKEQIDADIAKAFEGTGQTAGNAFTFGLLDKVKSGLSTITETFNEAIADPIDSTVQVKLGDTGKKVEQISEDSKRTLQSIGQTAVSSFSSAFGSITDGTKSASEGFKDFAKSAISSIQRILLEAALLRALTSAFPSVFGAPQAAAAPAPGVATGGFFNGKKITHRFAEGGAVSGPGSGTSDSIVARLSNGEFVSDARTVSYFGPDFFSNLKKMARGFNVAPQYSGGLPAFANGGLVSGQGGGETRVMIQNSGAPKEAKNVSVEQDAQGTIVSIILEDIQRNGNISKGFQTSFGLKRSGV